jgi:SAM-dependent methyltransferase
MGNVRYNATMIFALLGRQSKLGLAELESLVGAKNVHPVGTQAALVDGQLNPDRLGSVIRLASPIAELQTAEWPKIASQLGMELQKLVAELPEGKLKLGISVFGVRVSAKQLFAAGLDLKKALHAQSRSVRIIPNNQPELNSAQVLHNGLIGDLGIELLVVKNDSKTWLARTTWVQDIDAYAARDQKRPNRDAFVGMLPPKLAQTMLNLAQVKPGESVLDPFCGTGTVLQEAALLGCPIYGSDISERMVRYTRDNIAWLKEQHQLNMDMYFETADATTHTWRPPLDHVVCETYLGQPLSGLPKPEKLAEIMQDCNVILTKFLRNLRPQLKTGARLCIAVPAWRVGNQFKHLNLLDHLENLGYNHLRFQLATWDDLTYHRPDQIVARELLVLTVK